MYKITHAKGKIPATLQFLRTNQSIHLRALVCHNSVVYSICHVLSNGLMAHPWCILPFTQCMQGQAPALITLTSNECVHKNNWMERWMWRPVYGSLRICAFSPTAPGLQSVARHVAAHCRLRSAALNGFVRMLTVDICSACCIWTAVCFSLLWLYSSTLEFKWNNEAEVLTSSKGV